MIRHNKDYKAYILSSAWQLKRQEVFTQRGRICEKCGKSPRVLQVHHLTYVRLFHERLDDLMIVCIPCHKDIHKKKRVARVKKKKTPKLTRAQKAERRLKRMESGLSSRDKRLNERHKRLKP